MNISSNIEKIHSLLPDGVQLVCVSKFHTVEAIREAYDSGERAFGESRSQELIQKQKHLPPDIQWHFIGHLQSNKVKQIVPFVHMIHSVDSFELLEEINRCAEKINRTVRVLLEVHIAQEEQKYGFLPEEIRTFFSENRQTKFPFICFCGLMGMATFTEDKEQIEREFKALSTLFGEIKADYFIENASFCELSMGMSNDFPIAVKHGSTMVRIGSSIFGSRI